MGLRSIIKLFESGNVCVVGLRRRGKDMLMANVVMRRKLPYISNTDYGGECFPLDFDALDCGGNSYEDFIAGNIKYYEFPYPWGTDIYHGDGGVYTPSQFQGELCRRYKHLPTFMAISAQIGGCNYHFNVQNLKRMWDKIREQSDIYIMCRWCKVFGKLVVQRVWLYENGESAERRVPPWRLPRPWLSPDRIFHWKMAKQNYEIAHGVIKSKLLVYFNKSSYNTLIFKEMLVNGKKENS